MVWIALLLLIASWIYTYLDPKVTYRGGGAFNIPGGGSSPTRIEKIDWSRLFFIDLTIIALAAGFLFTFRGKNEG